MITERDRKIAYNLHLYKWNCHRDDLLKKYCKKFSDRDFWFGQYKGENIAYIITFDYQYITWLINNTQFKLSEREQAMYDVDSVTVSCGGGFSHSMGGIIEEIPGKTYYPDRDLLENI